jgi:hypothetical protein
MLNLKNMGDDEIATSVFKDNNISMVSIHMHNVTNIISSRVSES